MAEIPALFFARPEKRVSLRLMPPVSSHTPSVASESVSASLISFVLIFAIALSLRRDFSTAVSSLPYNVRGGTPQFVETSHTAGKVFFTVATDEDLGKTWLAAPAGCVRGCSRTLFRWLSTTVVRVYKLPLTPRVCAGSSCGRVHRRHPPQFKVAVAHPSKRFNTPAFLDRAYAYLLLDTRRRTMAMIRPDCL